MKYKVGYTFSTNFYKVGFTFSKNWYEASMARLRPTSGQVHPQDVIRILKCAKRKGISDFTTICIQQKLIEKDKDVP